MKTIMDAVNELKGDNLYSNFADGNLEACDWVILKCIAEYRDSSHREGSIVCGGRLFDSRFYRLICSYEEYKSEISELSNASWIKGASLAEYQAADKEVLTVENKTVEVDGMAYEIGKLYLFSDGNGDFEIGELSAAGDINDGNGFMYQSKVKLRKSNKYEWWNKLSTIDTQIGTITPAPVKLVDGAAYEFDYNNGLTGMNNAVMRYRKSGDYFYFDNTIFKREHCTNIIPLVPQGANSLSKEVK